VTSSIKGGREETEDVSVRTIEFCYKPAASIITINMRNKVVLTKGKGSEVYTIRFLTLGQEKGVQRAVNLLRQTIMEWSIERGKRS